MVGVSQKVIIETIVKHIGAEERGTMYRNRVRNNVPHCVFEFPKKKRYGEDNGMIAFEKVSGRTNPTRHVL